MKKSTLWNISTLAKLLLIMATMLVAFYACKKVVYIDGGKYLMSMSSEATNGKVFYSIDNTHWVEMKPGIDTIVMSNQRFYFKVEPNAGYQFIDWGTVATSLLGTDPITQAVHITKDMKDINPTLSQVKSEYSIVLGTIVDSGGSTGSIEYSIDAGATWLPLTKTPKILPAGTSIQFKAIENQTNTFFWQWNAGVSGFDPNPPAIILNNDMSVSATFGNFKRTNVAIIPISTNGHIEWSTSETGIFEPLNTSAPYDSIPAGATVYFKAVPAQFYEFTSWDISPGILNGTGNQSIVNATITQESTITLNVRKRKHIITVTTTPANTNNTITFSTAENGTYVAIPNAPWEVEAGTTLWFKATPNTGNTPFYRFDKWGDDAIGGTTTTTSVLVDGDKTISAQFIQQYKIDVAAVPTGATAFFITGMGTATTGSTPTANHRVDAGGTGYFDAGIDITATATPNTRNPYYRLASWGSTLPGTPADGTNITTYAPSGDATISAPTFQQQYKLDISKSGTGIGYFVVRTSHATSAGNQPIPSTIDENILMHTYNRTNEVLTGFFDKDQILNIETIPDLNNKIRYIINGSNPAIVLPGSSYTMIGNTTIEGVESQLTITDVNVANTYNLINITHTGNPNRFGKIYNGTAFIFTLDGSGTLSNVTINGDIFTVTQSTPSVSGLEYKYQITSTVVAGNTPIGTIFTFSFILNGSGDGELQDIKISAPNTNTDGSLIYSSITLFPF